MSTHTLKSKPEYYHAILKLGKTAEIRKNDRDYKVDDVVYLNEIGTLNTIEVVIAYITDYEQKEGNVVFCFEFLRKLKRTELSDLC